MSTSSSSTGGSGTGGSGQGGMSTSSSGTGGSGGGMSFVGDCSTPPPPGAALAPAPPTYSGGSCPTLVDGHNPFTSQGNARDFRLVIPANLDPNERLPVVFLWHWLGGSADDFFTRGEIQLAADTQRFLGVIPESKGDIIFKWPFEVIQTDARMQEEFVFFDDMLACVSEQFNVNKECVASAGVSAGALFTDQLAGGRGEYLSSIISLSGGVGDLIKPFGNPAHRMPAVVLWGGPTDNCFGVMNFDTASKNLEQSLTTRGHFFLECIHNCGHAEPPLDKPPGLSTYAAMWQFVLDHPYWLSAGQSSYLQGLPAMYPTWCAIGAGSATPRTGTCPNAPGC
jgi:predicted esterase